MRTPRATQRPGILILLGALLLASSQAAALGLSTERKGEPARLFDYDRTAAFDLKEESAKEQGGVTVRDVNYAAYDKRRGRVKAYLVKPGGKGPFACVLFFHWLGRPNGDRNEFLDEAVSLAKQGTLSLLIQGYFPWSEQPTDGPTDRQRVIDQTIEVRRALDLLLAQPGVDAKRVGYVGHDYGAMYGSILSGVEHRVRAYVFIAAIGNFSDWSLKYWPATAARGEQAYRQALEEVDPIHYVSRAAPAALLFQFSNSDMYISKEAASAFYARASGPKQIKWYDADHDLNVEAARSERRAWLTRQLRLAQPK